MNTTKKGDEFEDYSYRKIDEALKNQKLGIIPEQARLFKKKTQTNVVFNCT